MSEFMPKKPINQTMALAISCITLLSNTAITNQIVLAQATKPSKCDISVYVIDKDPQGLNIRNGASTNNRILGKVPQNETVKILATSGTWAQINNTGSGFKGTGWAYLPNLGISTRGYNTKGVDIYASANPKSRKLARVPASTNVKFIGCQGQWVQVEYKGVKGWLTKLDQCGAALTSCS